jgi:hypothetical protein
MGISRSCAPAGHGLGRIVAHVGEFGPELPYRNAAGQLRALPEAPVVVNLADVAVIFSLA